jgi:hypothetical protein
MKKEQQLERPIDQYLRTVNTGDADRFLSVFADDALVQDLERTIRGREAIDKWARHDIFAVEARFQVVKVAEGEGRTVLTVEIDGTFDRRGLPDPLLMDQSFKIEGGKIAELKVTFASEPQHRGGTR